ncbi:MAG: GtrA family protein [Halioglobus sp.]
MFGQLVRFLGVGCVATLTQYLILIFLAEIYGTDPVLASAIGFAISSILNYLLNYYFTFSSSASHIKAMPKFALVATSALMLNTLCMYILHSELAIHYLVSQVLSTGLVLVWNFVINRHWTYQAAGQ